MYEGTRRAGCHPARRVLFITFEIMHIKIRAFGIAKDILSATSLEYEVAEGTTINQLRRQLSEEFPAFESLRSLAFAINESYANGDTTIAQGDEVVLIPPVSGG
jgi:molybdopterin synthase sulfur carrier subunit